MNDEIVSFLTESLRLKKMVRSGWIYSGVSLADVESVADHSYFVTLIAFLLACSEIKAKKEIDLEKILIMALIHDLSESVSQDIDRRVRKFSPKKYDDFKSDLDTNAIGELFDKLPKFLEEKFLPIYSEYRENNSKEAQIVKEADRLETLLQLKEYVKLGYRKENFQEFYDNLHDEIDQYTNPLVIDLAKKILAGEDY